MQAVVDGLRIASSGRPGPVLIDLPTDVASAPAGDETHAPYLPGYRPRERPNGRQIRRAAEALASARRPVLYAGGGVLSARATPELAALAEALDVPVAHTLMGKGVPFLEQREKNHFIRVDPPEWQQAIAYLDQSHRDGVAR